MVFLMLVQKYTVVPIVKSKLEKLKQKKYSDEKVKTNL